MQLNIQNAIEDLSKNERKTTNQIQQKKKKIENDEEKRMKNEAQGSKQAIKFTA